MDPMTSGSPETTLHVDSGASLAQILFSLSQGRDGEYYVAEFPVEHPVIKLVRLIILEAENLGSGRWRLTGIPPTHVNSSRLLVPAGKKLWPMLPNYSVLKLDGGIVFNSEFLVELAHTARGSRGIVG